MTPLEAKRAYEKMISDSVARAVNEQIIRQNEAVLQQLARERRERVRAGTATPREIAAEVRACLIRQGKDPADFTDVIEACARAGEKNR